MAARKTPKKKSSPKKDLVKLLEAKIKAKETRLMRDLQNELVRLGAVVQGLTKSLNVRPEEFEKVGAYKLYGIESDRIDEITVQLGTLGFVRCVLLELQQETQ